MANRTFGLILISWFLGAPAYAGNGVPLFLPFQGRATDTNGNPINYAATFKFRIYPPAGNCYIYEDTQSITPNSFGFFSVVLGTGANSTGPGNNLTTVFSNETPINDSCSGTYTPAGGDWRRIEIVVDGTPMPTMQTISASAFSINSQLFDGKNSTQFIQVNGNANQANFETLTGGGSAVGLHHHDGVYAKLTGGAFTGSVTTSGSIIGSGSNSQIGLGTTTTNADLDIYKDSPSIRLDAIAGHGGNPRIEFFSGGTTQRAMIRAAETTNELRFYTGSSEAMRLDSSQNMILSGSMDVAGTVGFGKYTDAQQAVLTPILSGMGASAVGTMWTNSDHNAMVFWNGTSAVTLASGTFGGDVSGSFSNISVDKIKGRAVASTAPANGQFLMWNNSTSQWEPSTVTAGVSTVFGRSGAVVAATNDYTWAQIDKGASSLADLATRSASDLNSGTLSDSRLSANVPLLNAANAFTNANSIAVATTTKNGLILKSTDNNATKNIFEVQNSAGTATATLRYDGVPTATTDLSTKTYVDTLAGNYLLKSGGTMSGNIAMASNKVTGLAAPSAATDAATKGYADAYLATRTISSAAPAAGDAIVWNNSTGQWEPQALPSAPVSSVYGRTGAVVAATNDYTWAQINKGTSSLADLATRNASDLTGTLNDAQLSSNVPLINGANAFTNANTITVATTTKNALVLKSSDNNATKNILEVQNSAGTATATVRYDGVPTAATDLVTKSYSDSKLATRAVASTAPSNGQVMAWNNTTSTWEPQSVTSGVSSVYGRTGAVVSATNDYTWAQIDKGTSSLADLATRNASDLTGTLNDAQLSANVPLINGANAFTNGNSISVATTTKNALILKSTDNNATKNILEIQNSAGTATATLRYDGTPTANTDLTTKTYVDNKLGTRTLSTSAPNAGDALVWNGTTSKWEPIALPSAPVSSVYGRTGVVVAATNDYTWAQIDKGTSSLADLATRSASDLSSGTLNDSRLSANVPLINGANAFTNGNSISVATTTKNALILKSTDNNATKNIFEIQNSAGTATATLRYDGTPTANTDLTTKNYVDTSVGNYLLKSGGTMSGAIAMGTNKITGMGDPSAAQDAATKNYVDTFLGSRTLSTVAPAVGQVMGWNNTTGKWEPTTLASAPVSSVYGRTGTVVAATNDYTWAQIDKGTSSLADLATRSASDLSSGTLNDSRLSANVPLINGANAFTNGNSISVATTTKNALILKSTDNNATKNILEIQNSAGTATATLRYDGTPTATTDLVTKTYVDTADANYLPKAGGTMSGAIAMGTNKITGMGDPSAAQDAATKNYVDTFLGSRTLSTAAPAAGQVMGWNNATGKWEPTTPANAPVSSVYGRTGAVTAATNDYTWAQIDKGTSSLADLATRSATDLSSGTLNDARLSANVPLINGANAFSNANSITVATTTKNALILKSTDNNATKNILEIQNSAGTATATLRYDGTPTAATDLTTKNYVDTSVGNYLLKSGGTMSGAIAMGTNKITGMGDPSAAQDAATKNYVDTFLGTRTLSTAAPSNGQVITWNNTTLKWEPQSPGSAPVSSVYGRTGAVVAATNDYTWAQIDKGTSSLADLATRSATDLSSGTLNDARLSANVPLINGANAFSNANSITVATTTKNALILKSSDNNATKNILEIQNSAGTATATLRYDGTPTAATDLVTKSYADGKLATRSVASTLPTNGQVMTWNNTTSTWEPQSVTSGVSTVFGRSGAVTASTNDYTWAQIDKGTSSLADLATRSASDLSSGTLNDSRLSANVPLINGANAFSNSNSISVATTTKNALILKSTDNNATKNILEIQNSAGTATATLRYDGTPTANTDLVTKTYVDTADANYLPKAGGTMSGAIAMGTNKITGMGDPTAAQDAATKNYVDTFLGTRTLSTAAPSGGQVIAWNSSTNKWEPQSVASGVSAVFGRTGAVTASTNDYTWAQIDKGTSSLADLATRSATDLTSGTLNDSRLSANVPLINGANAFSNANSITVATTTKNALILKSSDNNATKNILEIQNSAGTATATLRYDGTPTAATDLVTKSYADGKLATRSVASTLPTNGQVMAWNNTTSTWEPQSVTGGVSTVFGRSGAVTAATNDYTWAQIDKGTSSLADLATRSASDLSSGTLNDSRLSANVPLINGANAFTNGNSISVATTTKNALILKSTDNNATKNILEVQNSAGTATATLRYDGTPTANTDLVTKTYVDTADANYLPKAGGTMSGAIAMGTNKITGMGDPTAAQDAATKNYVDTFLGSRTLSTSAPSNGQVITWNNSTGKWEPQSPGSAPVSSVYGRTGAVVAATNDYTWAQIDKGTSSLADLATRSATDLTSGTLNDSRLSANVPLINGANAFSNANSITVATTTKNALILKSSDNNATKNILEIQNSSGTATATLRYDGTPTAGTDLVTKSYADGKLATRSVASTLPTNGQVMTWNNTTSTWEPTTPASAPVSSVYGRTGAVVAATNDYTWAQIDKGTSSLADLATRSATDLTSGTLNDSRLSANVPLINGANAFSNANSITVATTTKNALILKSSDNNATKNILEIQNSAGTATATLRYDGTPTASTDLVTKSYADGKLATRAVASTLPTNGQVMTWNNTTSTWEPQTVTSGVSTVFGRSGTVTAATNDYTWAQIDKGTSSLADLATRSASDLSSGTLSDSRLSANVPLINGANAFSNANSITVATTTKNALILKSSDNNATKNILEIQNSAGTATATLRYDGTPTANTDLTTKTYVDTAVGNYLPKAGGTMSGAIAMGTNKITGMGDPTAAQDAATKNYVDTFLGSRTLSTVAPAAGQVMGWNNSTGKWEPTTPASAPVSSVYGRTGAVVAATNDYTWAQIDKGTSSLADLATRSATDLTSGTLNDSRLSTNVPLINGANAFTNENTITVATATKNALILKSSDNNTTKNILEIQNSAGAATATLRYDGTPTATTDLTTKTYVDTLAGNYLLKSGGTMSGAIAMGTNKITGMGDPSAAQDAATKNYVDTFLGTRTLSTAAPSVGQVMGWNNSTGKWEPTTPASAPVSSVYGRTGAVVAATNDYTWAQIDKGTSSLADLATRSATDLSSGTLNDARLSTNVPLLNINNAFSGAITVTVGTTSKNALVLKSSDNNTTKNIFEVQNSAGTATATLRYDGTPTASTDLTPKSYVDTLAGNYLLKAGGNVTGNVTIASATLELGGTGILSAQTGSAGSPSYTFTGNTNTGMYSSGANTINFTTGGTSRLSINSTGDLVSTSGSFASSVANSGTAVGFLFNTSATYSTAGAKLMVVSNNGTEKFSVDKDGVLRVGGVTVVNSSGAYQGPLPAGQVIVGNSSGVATAVTISGDVTITNAGAISIGQNKITQAMLDTDDEKCAYIEQPGSSETLTYVWRTPTAATVTEIYCRTSTGATVPLDLKINSGSGVKGSNISCSSAGVSDTTLTNTALSANDTLDVAIGSVTGAPTFVSVCWKIRW